MNNNIMDRDLIIEMEQSYLDYSMSVIVSRALPDVKDGLKPVHRRILFGMSGLGMTSDKPHKKSARIVGEVLGKYHPHGDTAVYNTMVRMAQDFSYRYELIDGHGNFGSIDGDAPAAMRYTEARMSKISAEMLKDLEKNTIDYRKNFDDSLDEPVVLPTRLPNLLLNGSTGIAVGMATNIPPHNLTELIDGTLAIIDKDEITNMELLNYVKGPDFPTGGIINGRSGIIDAYTTGRGKVKTRGKVHVETKKGGREAIIITEIPYQVNKAKLIEKIAGLVKDKKITGISDLRDESDRDGIRVVIELKKGEDSELIINGLYKYTDLQTTFGIIMLSLVDNVPQVLTLKEMLVHFINHRKDVILRRTRYDLDKTEARVHILEGFRKALDNIDKIISIIRASKDSSLARETLISGFSLTEIQARAILDMKLQRLTGLERDKVEKEYDELNKMIKKLVKILGSEKEVLKIVKKECNEVKKVYGDKRKTEIIEEVLIIEKEDLIKDEEVVVTLTNNGYIKRMDITKYKGQKRGGKGSSSHTLLDDDFISEILTCSTLDTMLFFTNIGKVHSLKVYDIQEASKVARGKLINNLIRLKDDECVTSIIKVSEFNDTSSLLFTTKHGLVKKTALSEFNSITKAGLKAIGLNENDGIVNVELINDGEQDIFVATKLGKSIRFTSEAVRVLGRAAKGVKSINLGVDDEVVSSVVLSNEDKEILIVTDNGYGKRTSLDEYKIQNRGGKGLINIKLTAKNGYVIGVNVIDETKDIMLVTTNGTIMKTPANTVSDQKRSTQGVSIMKVNATEQLASFAILDSEEE